MKGKILWMLITAGALSLVCSSNIFGFQVDPSQDTTVPKDWFLKDPEADKIQGLSVDKAYELLTGKPSRTIIVAVIDSGIDFDHEDLKDVMWVNEKEIPGNGIDDDKNGYIDDIHGWNFIGGKSGNVQKDTYELTREYVRLKSKYENLDEKKITKKDKAEYDYWLLIKDRYTKAKTENTDNYSNCVKQVSQYKLLYQNLVESVKLIKSTYQIENVTPAIVDTIKTSNPEVRLAKYFLNLIYRGEGTQDVHAVMNELKFVIEHNTEVCDNYKTAVDFGYNVDFNPRSIVGDNYPDLTNRNYGNNNVKGNGPVHGTHVAGIIAANRKNNIGINGIADNVKIMAIRAVPNGDERDKDIANAIRYAVDNGALVINMSFGKDYSPQKEYVDQAVKYAESKDVILVHAAGNDNDDNDTKPSYPSRFFKDGKEASNWIEVGASTWGADSTLAAEFSNYGKKSVDVFAPGAKIYSTTPDNGYREMDGTSMASPAAAGVVALLRSYFPELSAKQIREVIDQSSRKFDNLPVMKPGSDQAVNFNTLSISGGLVNAYEAVKLAMTYKGGKKVEK